MYFRIQNFVSNPNMEAFVVDGLFRQSCVIYFRYKNQEKYIFMHQVAHTCPLEEEKLQLLYATKPFSFLVSRTLCMLPSFRRKQKKIEKECEADEKETPEDYLFCTSWRKCDISWCWKS
jgi:hypothetical protein